MNGVERLRTPQVRVAIAIVLVVVTALSVRGFIPEAPTDPRRAPQGGVWSVIAVIVLMTGSAAIAIVGLIVLLRNPGIHSSPLTPLPELDRRRSGQKRRLFVIGAATVIVFAALVAALSSNVGTQQRPATSVQQPQSERSDSGDQSAKHPAPQQNPPEAEVNLFPVLAASVAVMGVAFVVGSVVIARRNRSGETEFDDYEGADASRPDPVSTSLAHAAELGLAEMSDPAREPRAAIIACYAAMERGLADAPEAAPLASDTPSEVLARAVDHGALHSGAARSLVDLFTEARFSPHRMTEDDRESAVGLLERVLADLRGASWAG